MEDAKEKKLVKDQETIKPEGETKEKGYIPEKDLDKVAGGVSLNFTKIEY